MRHHRPGTSPFEVGNYSIATAHSAGPGYELRLCVVCCILGMCLAICWSSGGIRRGLGGYLGAFGSHLGPSWAMLGPSWGYLGKTWGLLGLTLGLDHQAWKTHTFLKASLEHAIAVFAYKTHGIVMALKMQCSADIKNTYLAEL